MRYVLPIILVSAAIGLFVGYIDPTYQNIKILSAESAQYNDALLQSSQVRQVRDQLLARRNTFSTDSVRKIERLLPDNVDNIRLIIDINDIAARYNLSVADVSFTTDQGANNAIGGGSSVLGSVTLSFTVASNYNSFVSFLGDLERSLRLVDVRGIKFGSGIASKTDTSNQKYTVTVKTYWLR